MKLSVLIKSGILFTILAYSAGGCSQEDTEPFMKLNHVVSLGEVYASSTVNVSIFRRSAVLSTPKGQFVAFFDAKKDVKVLLLVNGRVTKAFTVLPKLSEHLIQNGHTVISLGYSSDGILHVMFGAHNTQPYYAQIDMGNTGHENGYNIQAVAWKETLTYPQFYNVGDKLWLLYRQAPDIYAKVYNVKKRGFESAYETSLLNYAGLANYRGASVYINQMAVRGNKLALFWVYRIPPIKAPDDEKNYLVVNDGIWFARSYDSGKSWVAQNGERLHLPISYETISKIGKTINIPQLSGLINQGSSALGDDGRAYDVHQSKDSDGIPQVFLTVIGSDNTVLVNEAVSTNKHRFDLLGKGTLLLPLSRADIAVSKRMVHVIYRQENRLLIASKLLKDIGVGGTWQYFSPATIPLGGWEPNYDFEAWDNEQKLVIYVQGARQGRMDSGIEGLPSPAYLYEFKESEGW